MNLLYYSLGNCENYLCLFEMHIKSLKQVKFEGDILIITKFPKQVKQILSVLSNKAIIIDAESNDLFTSSALKFSIFKYPNVYKEYNKFLYVDVDTLWIKSPNNLFNLITNDEFYVSEEETELLMDHKYWSGNNLFTKEYLNYIQTNKIKGKNAGVFGFTQASISFINEVYNNCFINPKLGGRCVDQPFLNLELLKHKNFNTVFNSEIDHNGYKNFKCNKTLLHFAGLRANYAAIKTRCMKNYLLKLCPH